MPKPRSGDGPPLRCLRLGAYLFSADPRKVALVLLALDHAARGEPFRIAELAREVELPKTSAWRTWSRFCERLGAYYVHEDRHMLTYLERTVSRGGKDTHA